jgi:ribonuclease D
MEMKMKRTEFQICKEIFEALFQNNPIHKSDLRNLTGLGQSSINKWVDLIGFIQSQSKLKITKVGRHKILELEKPPLDETVYPETIEALKAMKAILKMNSEEIRKELASL